MWYDKFKLGQTVTVVRKVVSWGRPTYLYGASWASNMDGTIGKSYKIIEINKEVGYRLLTRGDFNCYHISAGCCYPLDYYYPAEALACQKNEQLLFDFMNE